MLEKGRLSAILSLFGFLSATITEVNGWVAARADVRRRPMAPAPKTNATVSESPVSAPRDLARVTSCRFGGLERLMACMHTASGSIRAPWISEIESGRI